MSDSLAHQLLRVLEHAGIGGAGIRDLADEHLPAVDPETGVRPESKATKPAASSSSSASRKRGRASGRKAASKPAGTSGGSASTSSAS